MTGLPAVFGRLFDHAVNGVFVAMFTVLGFVLLRLIFRRTTLAIGAFALMTVLFQSTGVLNASTAVWIAAAFQLCIVVIATTMVVRYGLLVTAVALGVGNMLEDIPLTLSLSHWTATTSNITLAVVLAIAFFGFYAARAGQPLFGNVMADR